MDIIQSTQQILCQKHKSKASFIKIFNQNEGNEAFFCDLCIMNDPKIQLSNFIHISQINEASGYSILNKWPPLDNQLLLEKLSSSLSDEDIQLTKRIDTAFEDLKSKLCAKLDTIKKNILKDDRIVLYQQQQEDSLNRLRNLSQISTFQQLLRDDIDSIQKEKSCIQFISQFIKDQSKNTTIFQNSIEMINQQQKQVNINRLNELKESILQILDQFTIFSKIPVSDQFNLEQNYQVKQKNQSSQVEKQLHSQSCIDLLPQLEMILSQYGSSQSIDFKLNKFEMDQIQIISPKQISLGNYYSNIVLKKNKKYVFRFNYDCELRNEVFIFGLVRNSEKDKQHAPFDNLSCFFRFNKNSPQNIHQQMYGIQKEIKGSMKNMGSKNSIELRVSIGEGILDVLDYPNYNNKVSLLEEYKINLQNYEDLRLGIHLHGIITVNITFAGICSEFES